MAEVTFYFPANLEYIVRVAVEDPTDPDQVDEAYDNAINSLPSGLCFQCSGYRQKWSLDGSYPGELEATHAVDENETVVWGDDPYAAR